MAASTYKKKSSIFPHLPVDLDSHRLLTTNGLAIFSLFAFSIEFVQYRKFPRVLVKAGPVWRVLFDVSSGTVVQYTFTRRLANRRPEHQGQL